MRERCASFYRHMIQEQYQEEALWEKTRYEENALHRQIHTGDPSSVYFCTHSVSHMLSKNVKKKNTEL
jgi:hypothetical protein